MKPRSFDLGGCSVTLLDGGALRLDGGAMFGLIPKPLWARTTPADDQNRIQLACNCLLVEWAGESARRAIIETGHGPKYDEKDRRIFAIDPARWLLTSLAERGVDPASITDVLLSHLHFDHAGGLTRYADADNAAGSSNAVATFPNARVHVQRRELDDARGNFGIMNATYREENFRPIDALNAWVLHDGEADALPGIRLIPSPGHTRGHQSILIEGRGRAALFLGDVMPTSRHVGAAYNMGYDLLPLDNRATKATLLAAAAEREWLVVIDHEPATPIVRVGAHGSRFVLTPVGD